MTAEIIEITELEQIRRCAPVLRELRTGLTEAEIVERVQQQMNHGYRLVCIATGESVQSVAGYRVVQNLHNGTFSYVDDLVTRAGCKRSGFAGRHLIGCGNRRATKDVRRWFLIRVCNVLKRTAFI